MATTITKVLNTTTKSITGICNRFFLLSIKQDANHHINLTKNLSLRCPINTAILLPMMSSHRGFHTTPIQNDLMEFFENKKYWGENEVKCGRAWNKDELRLKSNTDLHKLWYILLKEKNMLLTMENECNEQMELFPNPERIDKVKISMNNLEIVVRERNKAYYQLETGVTGERPGKIAYNPFGLTYYYKSCEHSIPAFMNTKWLQKRHQAYGGRAVRKFLLLYREKLYNAKRKAKNRNRNEVMMLLRRNPNLDLNLLKEKFPDVDISKLINEDKIRGHYVPKL